MNIDDLINQIEDIIEEGKHPFGGSKVKVDGEEVVLTDIEYRILLLLASHPQRIYSAQNIYELVWNEPYTYSSNNNVMVHIRNIRKKLGDDPQKNYTIRTVWGKGYRIE